MILKKKSTFIYLHSGFFKIMGRDKLFNMTELGQIFVPKKNKETEMRHSFFISLAYTGHN